MRFETVNGIVMHVAERGDGQPIVFSNSLGTDFRVWDPLLAHLNGRIRVIRYDKRGHGLSTAPDAPYRIDDHVADLAALLDHLGVAEAIVVGLSVGGIIAQGLAAARPELVKGLVLCDTAHKIGTPEMWDERIAAVREGGIDALAEATLGRWFSERFHRERPAELAGWRAMLTRTPVEGYVGTATAIRDADMTAAAQGIGVPTLCLGGTEDGSTPPEVVRSMAELIPGARFETIEGVGHLPGVEAPDALAALIGGFLADAGLT